MTQPLLNRSRRAFRYLPVLPFVLLPFIDITLFVVILIAMALRSTEGGSQRTRSSQPLVALSSGLVVLVALPGFVSSIADIAQRGP